jgi:hypothetical protein
MGVLAPINAFNASALIFGSVSTNAFIYDGKVTPERNYDRKSFILAPTRPYAVTPTPLFGPFDDEFGDDKDYDFQ